MKKTQGRRKPKRNFNRSAPKPEFRKGDIYEAADSDPEEDKNTGQRYDVSYNLRLFATLIYIDAL